MQTLNTTAFLAALCCCATLHAQQHDAVWPFGFHEYPGQGAYGNAALRFEPSGPTTAPLDWVLNFDNTSAALCDAEGKLLFATNGCVVVNAQGDTIRSAGGAQAINTGVVHDLVCADIGYPVPQGVLILPMPGNDQRFGIFHLGAQYDVEQKWTFSPLYLTIVDMAANGGQGQLVEVNTDMGVANMGIDGLSAVRHGNGRDWWLLVPLRNNNVYVRFLFRPGEVQTYPFQQIGPIANCPRNGSCVFSPDGRKFARTQNCRTVVFDFDRCTGTLSNPVEMQRPDYVFGGGGVAFSPSGKQLFVTEQLAVLTANLKEATPVLDTLVPSDSTIGVSLGLLQAGPDGRLYANSTHRSRYMASFNQTDDLGNLDFHSKGIFLGKYSSRTLPHFPNYRLLDLPGSPCDTLGISPVTEAWVGATPQIRPNPVQDILYLDLPTPEQVASVQLTDALGRRVYSSDQWRPSISVAHLPEGVYFLMIRQARGAVFSEKVVVRR